MHWFAHHALLLVIVASTVGGVAMCALVVAYGLSPVDPSPGATRRVLLTRFGHAIAGACFALAAVAAVVASAAPSPASAPSAPANDAERARLAAQVRELGAQLSEVESSLTDVTGRVGAVEARAADAASGASARAAERDRMRARIEHIDVAVRRLRDELSSTTDRLADIERSARATAALKRSRRDSAAVVRSVPPADLDGARETVPNTVVPVRPRAQPDPPSVSSATSAATDGGRPFVAEPATVAPAPVKSRPMPITEKMKHDWQRVKESFRTAPDELNHQLSDFGHHMRSWLGVD